ncbi:MAG: ABC transporter ATP-binding protein [Myxococcota bacterium]
MATRADDPRSAGLRVESLSKTYANGVQALDGVSLTVQSGMHGLLGPNGAGKSTLMRTLATLQRPDAGTFALDGRSGLDDPDGLRRRLGYLPQQVGAYPGVSARSLLTRFAWLKGRTEKTLRTREVDALLDRVNLLADANREVAGFSGGMLRRFGIALALLGQPRLLIVDEPTAGLDPAERNRFHRVLADVAADAVVLLSTHIVEDVENLCERVSILAGGRIVAEGTPESLREKLRGRVWSRVVPRDEPLPANPLHVVAAPGGERVFLVEDAKPEGDYEGWDPRLEDVYHHALSEAS